MASTFMGLEIAKKGLNVHQQALTTTGHNISNADNKNYSRQRVEMSASKPLYMPAMNREQRAGMIGQGVDAVSIVRIRDQFIEKKVLNAQQHKSYWESTQKYLHQLEIIYNEPAEESLRAQLDTLWQTWQELSQFPEEMSHRELVKTAGKEFSFRLKNTFERVFALREEADKEIQASVGRMNDIAKMVSDLSSRIQKSLALGDNPNDLKDKRDALLGELSEFVDISVEMKDPDEFYVYIGSQVFIQGDKYFKLQTKGDSLNEGLSDIYWEVNNQDAVFKNGKLQSLLELRDQVLRDNVHNLNLLAVNVSDIVNEVHRDGFGLTKETNIDFFQLEALSRNIQGNFDLDNNGAADTTAIFKIAGKNEIDATRALGISGSITLYKNDEAHTPINIIYQEDETLQDVINKINRSDAGVVAYVNHNENLVLKGKVSTDDYRKNFVIRHLEDSGELLVGYTGILLNSGDAGAFDYRRINEINKLQSDSERITLTPAFNPAAALKLSNEVNLNPSLIATAQGKDIGGVGDFNKANGLKDGSNAIRIAQALKHNKNMIGNYETVDHFYNGVITKIGIDSQTSKQEVENQSLILTNLENLRQSVMGVNLDEEMANMVQFQHAYNASAKMITVVNEMLGRIIDGLIR